MPHSPPAIRHTPFFAFSHYALRRYIVTPSSNTTHHHDQKDGRPSQLSNCPLGRRSRNAAFRVSGIGAGVNSNAALCRRDNRV